MSLQGLPGMSPAFRNFVQEVRYFTRDIPELNRLTAGEESSDRQIAWAVLDALSDFNGTPHLTTMLLEDFLERNQRHLLLRMTVVSLIESVGLLQTRNHINYSNGGVNVGVNDKTPMLMNWLQYFKSSTEQKKTRFKVAINIEGMMGGGGSGVSSELWFVNGTYASF